jgi:predicted transposase/invertase (TIGR01784 family)
MGKQANQYDKIFKENIEAVIPGLMQNVLGITAISSEEIPDDIQHTKERKPDVLKKVTDNHGNTFILQIEFQVADESEMVYRMAEYYVMLERKYKLPVEQFVIFLGSSKPQMPTHLGSNRMKFDFSLISFADLDYQLFLKSGQPEEVVMGVLADFKGESPEKALQQIIERIEETAKGDFQLKKYFKQLRVLAQLRKFEKPLKELVMDNIGKFVSQERDAAYLVGLDKGGEKAREQEQTKFVTNLLTQADFSVKKVAEIAGVSVEFVKTIQQRLSANR